MTVLRVEQLSLSYDTVPIVHSLDLKTPSGQITALIGPNGYGKSTLLRGLARLLKPKGGSGFF